MSDEQLPVEPGQPQESDERKWGDPLDTIPAERQKELRELAERQEVWAAQPEGQRELEESAFKGVKLNGAEVFFLAAYALAGPEGDLEAQAARLRAVTLDDYEPWRDIHLSSLHLEGVNLGGAQLQGAYLGQAQLQGADLSWVQLQRADLTWAQLQRAILTWAQLEGAILGQAQLQGAILSGAQLEGANLRAAQLEGAYLGQAQLQGADLGNATLDGKTTLANATILAPNDERPLLARLFRRPRYGPALGDLHWGNFDLVQLTQLIGWEDLRRLADERDLGWREISYTHRNAVRAYRQVAQRLRDQGFSDIADRLADRSQVLQRKLLFRLMLEDWRHPWRLPGDLVRWLFSWFLALLAGYGYHPGRSVFWYLATIVGFAFAYYQLGPAAGHAFQPDGAVVFSLTSFHGRGFFPGGLDVESIVTKLAAIEAVIGLLIEISFIATFTQRFFGAR